MTRYTLVVGIMDASTRLTINADRITGVTGTVLERIPSLFSLGKAFTTGILAAGGVFAANHNVSLAAKMLVIVDTIFHRTF